MIRYRQHLLRKSSLRGKQQRSDNVKISSPPSRDRFVKHNESAENIDMAKVLKVIYGLKADVAMLVPSKKAGKSRVSS